MHHFFILKQRSGFIQFFPLLLLAAFAVTTLVIANRVQTQQQEIRSRAANCYCTDSVHYYCPGDQTYYSPSRCGGGQSSATGTQKPSAGGGNTGAPATPQEPPKAPPGSVCTEGIFQLAGCCDDGLMGEWYRNKDCSYTKLCKRAWTTCKKPSGNAGAGPTTAPKLTAPTAPVPKAPTCYEECLAVNGSPSECKGLSSCVTNTPAPAVGSVPSSGTATVTGCTAEGQCHAYYQKICHKQSDGTFILGEACPSFGVTLTQTPAPRLSEESKYGEPPSSPTPTLPPAATAFAKCALGCGADLNCLWTTCFNHPTPPTAPTPIANLWFNGTVCTSVKTNVTGETGPFDRATCNTLEATAREQDQYAQKPPQTSTITPSTPTIAPRFTSEEKFGGPTTTITPKPAFSCYEECLAVNGSPGECKGFAPCPKITSAAGQPVQTVTGCTAEGQCNAYYKKVCHYDAASGRFSLGEDCPSFGVTTAPELAAGTSPIVCYTKCVQSGGTNCAASCGYTTGESTTPTKTITPVPLPAEKVYGTDNNICYCKQLNVGGNLYPCKDQTLCCNDVYFKRNPVCSQFASSLRSSDPEVSKYQCFTQNDPNWNQQASTPVSIGGCGCGPTSVANVLCGLGKSTLQNGKPLNPVNVVNGYFPTMGCGANVDQMDTALDANGVNSSVLFTFGYSKTKPEFQFSSLTKNERATLVKKQLAQNKKVIIASNIHGTGHYVVLIGYDEKTKTFIAVDSAWSANSDGSPAAGRIRNLSATPYVVHYTLADLGGDIGTAIVVP